MSNSSIWPIDRFLSGATTPAQSGPGTNESEEVLCIPQIYKAGALHSDGLMLYPGPLWGVEVLPLCRDAVNIFHSPS